MQDKLTEAPFIRRAIALACDQVEAGGGPFGAVIVQNGRIVGEGANQVALSNDPTAHAEIVAIRDACRALGRFDLAGCTLYSSCEPCPMCLAAVHWARLDRVVFAADRHDAARAGFDDAVFYHEMSSPAHERRIPVTQMAADGAAPFDAWTRKADRTRY